MRPAVHPLVIPVRAVRTAVPVEPVVRAYGVRIPEAIVRARRPGPAPAQQPERGDDRVEGIRVLSVLRHELILHAT